MVDSGFDAVDILCAGSSCKATEGIPKKGSRLLLLRALVCSWLEISSLMAEVIVVLLDLYMSCMLDNSSWSVVSSCVGADGCWSKDLRNCCVLVSCLVKSFQWHSKFPSDTCAVMIQNAWLGMLVKLVGKLPILLAPSEMISW